MITGIVNPFREPIIRVELLGVGEQDDAVEAIVDTGFTGSLTLPPDLIASLGLPFRRRGRALLADGSESLFDVYEAVILWDGQPKRVSVAEVDTEPLVGMGLLYGSELILEAIDGGAVTIRPLADL